MMKVRVGKDKKDKRFLTGTTSTLVILRFLGLRYQDYSIGQELFVRAYGQLDKIVASVKAGLAGSRWVIGREPMKLDGLPRCVRSDSDISITVTVVLVAFYLA